MTDSPDLENISLQIQQARAKFEGQLDSVGTDSVALESLRVLALGKTGYINELAKQLGKMNAEDRSKFGSLINALKQDATWRIAERKQSIEGIRIKQRLANERIDVTAPVRASALETGRIHPLSQVWDEVVAIFADMGFAVEQGPDIETDHYNFTALNFPEGHPAREMHDTFYFEPKPDGSRMLLRTHTSPVQIRTMEASEPPFRFICPGRTYRCDSDQTHTPQFHQIEGLVIDETTHMGHLKWTLEEFLRAFFEVDGVELRMRPSFFPFTEPSMEVDVRCARFGNEIRIGEGDDWLEILGCGMVHPNVLKASGIDPEKYQGFAFGVGLDRLAMLKYGIPDLRAFFEADLRWLRHYGFAALDVPTLAGGLSS